jgi:D-alanyl-D-alanine dipeptidase
MNEYKPGKSLATESVDSIEQEDDIPIGFVDATFVDSSLNVDMKYAASDNFTGRRLYPCSRCILRTKVAEKLKIVNQLLKQKGFQLILLDCYRPKFVQEKLWQSKPDPHFVMRPWKGSPHSRGIAVDVTLADANGLPVDMGSNYDEFTPKAYYSSSDISIKAQNYRWLLRTTMRQVGFTGIRTEWWHFQLGSSKNIPLEDFVWDCDI